MNERIEIAKPLFDDCEERAVLAVLRSGWVSQGTKVAEFEQVFADYVGARHAIATTSCTTALHMSLAALGVGSGDEVIVPSLSFIATANVVVHCGATPVFVDIDPRTCNIDPLRIPSAITDKTKAVIPVHQMGLPADIDAIQDIADRHGLHIIEDAACAIGSAYKGKRIGGHGNLACFSFHPRKIITMGEGGMVTTDDAELTAKLRRMRHHGMSVSDLERHGSKKVVIEEYLEIGYNYRMTDIQAAVGIEQLRKLPFILERRKHIADLYSAGLHGIPVLRAQFNPDYAQHNFQSYSIEIAPDARYSRDQMLQMLLDQDISCRRGVMAIHTEQCYKNYPAYSLPVTEKISSQSLLLPIHPLLPDADVHRIIDAIRNMLC